jgi:UDP-glucuronate 4-epimerase
MKIAITGAAGFIGSHTAELLVDRGHQVVGLDSFDDYLYPAEPKRANAAALAGTVEIIEGDITRRDDLGALLDREPDVVLHLAALAGVRPSLRQPARYIQTNLAGTEALLSLCVDRGVDRIVFASSSSVYGKRPDVAGGGFRESDRVDRPASPYAATKRAGELLCSTFSDLYGLGISALRYFTVYGPRQRHDMAIHKFTTAIAAGEPITLFGDGQSRRDYTYASDIALGTALACEKVEPGRFEIYNLGGTRTTSLADLVATIEDVVGNDAIVERLPDQPGDVPITFADISRAKADLGWEPQVEVREGVERFWAWLQIARS